MSTGQQSAEDTDAETGTRQEFFDENELQSLRSEAAKMVVNGPLTLDDISLSGRLDDGKELVDGENDAFRASVEDALDDVPNRDRSGGSAGDETNDGWRPTEVDFGAIWAEFDLPTKASRTQLELALDASRHTSFGPTSAAQALEYGVESGQLIDCEIKVDGADCDDEWISGLNYKRGDV